ncbi:hypothetical protein BCR33DRAFT_732928 [Rhizoclosmatium globosum]|uniref:Polycystin cation channel PKD1/PKD2 domain-containing protein n=1 Tax=Rhizoclosmatium globosum TaxID=329046 RepID=A0A1Y2D1I0_9FUNG|nr:hypothetical protein BCR33DRAFT_732928 [Rhizoclosmatium globosum]|eukprot:ORY53163.1 hypothetical protein BCR33DRAFT_732928 [Rhizoclosmatium globosum]
MKDTNNGQDTSSDWNSLMGSILWTVRFTYNMSDFDTMRNQAGYLAILIYLIYMLLVVILLLNMLIAMMNDSFTTISAHKKTQWLMQMARIIVKIDRTLSDNDKTLIKNDFGYHFNPKSEVTPSENTKWIQKGVDDVTTPVTRLFEKSNTSHDTQLDNKSREDGLKYGPFIGDSHVFLFLDKVGESGKWETIQLITGRRTGKDNEFVDFEFKLNSHDYWSLLNVACDFYYMFFNSQSLLNRYAKYD